MTAELRQYMEERFNRLEATTLIGVKNTLTAEEAAIYTGYTIKGIYTMTSQRRIPHFKKNGKLYFKKPELDEWMTDNRIMTDREINSKAETYTVTRNIRRP